MKIVKLALLAAMLVGCAASPESRESDADYGAAPINYEAAIRKYFADSPHGAGAQLREISTPEKVSIRDEPIAGLQAVRGWLVSATVNAKNVGDESAGSRRYAFLFRGEQLIRVLPPVASPQAVR